MESVRWAHVTDRFVLKGEQMTIQITVEVPDQLGAAIERYQDRLPELLALGLRELESENRSETQDVDQIIEVLASQPTPEEILALQPSEALQSRMSSLLQKGKTESLTRPEEAELERYLTVEHLVRLAKARALRPRNGE